jgi:hypothetical protein
MPDPVLAGCTEPLPLGAPDLRGRWQVVAVEVNAVEVADHPAMGHSERIEQCGDRLVVTSQGIIHDMRCDGTEQNGVDDVMQSDFATPIHVVASFEAGAHVLRPVGLDGFEVTRRMVGDQLVWSYLGAFVARMERVGDLTADGG